MKIRIEIELTDERLWALITASAIYGYRREEPRRRWSLKERGEAARYGAEAIIEAYLKSRVK
jgi:hypothetical protein